MVSGPRPPPSPSPCHPHSPWVTKRCRLSWLTNSAFVFLSPNAGGRGVVAGSQPMRTAEHRRPNKLWRSNSIFNLWHSQTNCRHILILQPRTLRLELHWLPCTFSGEGNDVLDSGHLPVCLYHCQHWPEISTCLPTPFPLPFLSADMGTGAALCIYCVVLCMTMFFGESWCKLRFFEIYCGWSCSLDARRVGREVLKRKTNQQSQWQLRRQKGYKGFMWIIKMDRKSPLSFLDSLVKIFLLGIQNFQY